MLTDNDLNKIGKLVRKEVKTEVAPVKTGLNSLKTDLKTLKTDVQYVKKTVDLMIKMFDRENFELKRRVEVIEEHLGIFTNK